MSASVSDPYSQAPAAQRSGITRVGVAVFGIAAVLVGGFLLFNPYDAARTLALLLGLALFIAGCLEISLARGSSRRGLAILPGAVLVVGAVLTAFWPAASLWTLAVLTGLSLLLHGVGRIALAFLGRSELPGWGWLALAGGLNIVVGIMAMAWPEATVLVLSLILGAQIVAFGLLLLVAAFAGSRTPA
jgi:uncharacterized membrane protein HdeD (DUF308 family)